ncbi:MAG: SLBB domain-containing protein [Syntrophus sp. (in: bacteria)]
MNIYSRSFSKLLLFVFLVTVVFSTAHPLQAVSEQLDKQVVVSAGDTLEIAITGQAEMIEKFEVGPEGDIYMVMIGKIHVEGMDIPRLTEEMKKRLKKYLEKESEITVHILARNRFVNIQGGVRYPGWYRAPHATNLDYLIETAGGILPGVDRSMIILKRKKGDGFQEFEVRGQVQLMSGDILSIHKSKTSINKIDNGDALFIRLPNNQDPTKEPVRNDTVVDKSGFITIPGVVHFYVQGLTTADASREIEKRLPPYQTRSSRVEVSILEKRHYVRVMGHIERPGWYNVPRTATVQEILSLAGGVIDGAVMSDVTIERRNHAGRLQIKVDLYQYGINGDTRILVPLHANDTIFVPIPPSLGNIRRKLHPWMPPDEKLEKDTKKKITIFGAVKNPGVYEPSEDMNLLYILVRAGGEKEGAELTNVTLTRNNRQEKVNLIGLLNGSKESSITIPKVYSGDTVYVAFVEKAWEKRKDVVYVIGQVKKPGVYELAESMGVLQAIALAGGLDEWADGSDIRIIRKTKGTEEHILFNYKKAVSKKADPLASILKSDDTIFVP